MNSSFLISVINEIFNFKYSRLYSQYYSFIWKSYMIASYRTLFGDKLIPILLLNLNIITCSTVHPCKHMLIHVYMLVLTTILFWHVGSNLINPFLLIVYVHACNVMLMLYTRNLFIIKSTSLSTL